MKGSEIILDYLDVSIKKNFKSGMYVEISEEKTNILHRGYILNVLSKQDNQSGIKVELTNHIIGHVVEIFTIEQIKLQNFKFYNKIFNAKTLYSLWDEQQKQFAIIDYIYHVTNCNLPAIILSDNKDDIISFIKNNNLNTRQYKVKSLNPNKDIQKHFKDDRVMILIKNEKYLRFTKFKDIENDIKIKTKTIR